MRTMACVRRRAGSRLRAARGAGPISIRARGYAHPPSATRTWDRATGGAARLSRETAVGQAEQCGRPPSSFTYLGNVAQRATDFGRRVQLELTEASVNTSEHA